jgi:hypothetical protein
MCKGAMEMMPQSDSPDVQKMVQKMCGQFAKGVGELYDQAGKMFPDYASEFEESALMAAEYAALDEEPDAAMNNTEEELDREVEKLRAEVAALRKLLEKFEREYGPLLLMLKTTHERRANLFWRVMEVVLGGLSIAFILALLGQDCICLDARILSRIYGDEGKAMSSAFSRPPTEGVLNRYEAVEDAFLEGNPFYRRSDPIGRARAQWMSWESVGGKPATHSTWLNVVR